MKNILVILLILIAPYVYAAFPQVEDITQTTINTAATAHNISMPATVDAGDLLLMIVTFSDGSATALTVTDPSGWSRRNLTQSSTANTYVAVKDAVGDEGGTTVDVATNLTTRAAAQVYRITGWLNSGTILDDVAIATVGSDDYNPPSLNPSPWDTEDTLWITTNAIALNSVNSKTGDPANYTNISSTKSTDDAPRLQLNTGRRELNAASEDPAAWTHSANNEGVQATIAVRPTEADENPESLVIWMNHNHSMWIGGTVIVE